MKKLVILFRRPPHGSPHGREGLDLAMLSASFEQQVTLIFCDQGVLHLLPNQAPMQIGARDYIKTLKALPMYDIDDIWACEQSLTEYSLKHRPLHIPVEIKKAEQITACLQQADEVLVF